jgi:homoserine kinase
VKLSVRIPATTANLGPGFDCLGMALDLWATVTVEVVEGQPPKQPSVARLVRDAFNATYAEAAAGDPPPIAVDWDAAIPIARGLGVSAGVRAAGILAANRLLGDRLDDERLLAIGARLEGHADNMAPALLGGFQVVVRAADRFLHVTSVLPEDLTVVLFVPEFDMPTHESRRRLPTQLSREDVVFNVSRSSLVVAALAAGRYDLLDEATQDRIHQPVRGEIFPALGPIMAAAKSGGAAASYLSGGGSTVAALTTGNEERVARLMTQAAIAAGYTGRGFITKPTAKGAHIAT